MKAAQVVDAEAAVYGPMVAGGKALVVVREPFSPFGAATTAISVVDAGSPMAVDNANPNRNIAHEFDGDLKELKIQHGYRENWPIPHLSPREPSRDGTIRHRFNGNFLFPHLSNRVSSRSSTIRRGFWGDIPMGHLIKTDQSSRRKSDTLFPFSNVFGIPPSIKR